MLKLIGITTVGLGIVGGIVGIGTILYKKKGSNTFGGYELKHNSYEGHIGYWRTDNNTSIRPTDLCIVCRKNNNVKGKIHYTLLNDITNMRQMYEHDDPENWPQINDPKVVNYVNDFFKEDKNHVVRLALTIPLPNNAITWALQYYCHEHDRELWQDIYKTTGINHVKQ